VVNRVGALMESRMGSTPPPPETKECPECAETVLAKARKCKFCGSTL
jgi:hypothetical protein